MQLVPHTNTVEDFWSKVDIGINDDCWLWQGLVLQSGYGQFVIEGKKWRVHRYAWTLYEGEIPEGLVIDHMCRVRVCLKREHLQLLTVSASSHDNGFNLRTHCHPLSGENLYVAPAGNRVCKECDRRTSRERNQRIRTTVPS